MRLALSIAVGALAAASASAALAQTPPPVAPPYHVIDAGEQALAIAAGGTVRKSGDTASITVIMGSHPTQEAESGIARMDMAYVYNCRNSTYRTPVAAAYDKSGALIGAIDDDSDWEAVAPDSNNSVFQAMACNGHIPEDAVIDGDLNEIIGVYRRWVLEN